MSNFVVAPPGRPYKADFNVCIDSDGLPVPLRFAHQIVEVAATKVLILRRVQWRTARGTDGGLVLKLGPNYDPESNHAQTQSAELEYKNELIQWSG